MDLVVDHVAGNDCVDRWDVDDGAGTDIALAHFDDPELVPFQLECQPVERSREPTVGLATRSPNIAAHC